MIEDITKDTESRMAKSIESLKTELSRMRTGRAHPGLLEHIKVDYYGNPTPLNQVANISIENSRTLTVTPWEKNMVAPIEKAIMTSNLGLNPATAGQVIRVPLPELNEERRRDLVRVVREEAEKAKVAIRNIRRDANSHFKELQKGKEISEDDLKRSEDRIQKLTDKYIGEVDRTLSAKEADLMEV